MKTIISLLALTVAALSSVAIAAPQTDSAVIHLAAAGKYANQGKVLDVMDTSMYTYIQVSTDRGALWLAASKVKVAKGNLISYPNGAVMSNFYSKSMNRTFDTIIFLDKIEILK